MYSHHKSQSMSIHQIWISKKIIPQLPGHLLCLDYSTLARLKNPRWPFPPTSNCETSNPWSLQVANTPYMNLNMITVNIDILVVHVSEVHIEIACFMTKKWFWNCSFESEGPWNKKYQKPPEDIESPHLNPTAVVPPSTVATKPWYKVGTATSWMVQATTFLVTHSQQNMNI